MARDRFKEQVAGEEAQDLIERLGFTLAKSHAGRQSRRAKTEDEREAWRMIERRIRPSDEAGDGFTYSEPESDEPESGGTEE